MSGRYNCPKCGNALERVKQSQPAMLNSDQFDAFKAGGWYCLHDRLYWWEISGSLHESTRQSRLSEESA